jgi:hypothetical protein
MPKCRRCGNDASLGKRICPSCLRMWSDIRLEAFDKVKKELGNLTRENQVEFTKRVKKLEKKIQKEKGY